MLMGSFYWIAQVVGIIARAFNILSYQQKTRTRAIGFQLFGILRFDRKMQHARQ